MIALLFVVGPLVVVPILLAVLPPLGSAAADRWLDHARHLALPTAAPLAIAFVLPPSLVAGLFALPWLGLTVMTALAASMTIIAGVRDGSVWRPSPRHGITVALGFLAVAGANAAADRFGIQPFGFAPTIVLLTAVHFTFAGFALVVVGAIVWDRRPNRWLEVALGAVVLGIPVTAIGFFGIPLASWLGALLVAGGGFGIGVGLIKTAPGPTPRRAVWLARVAGASLLVSMPLAVTYATGRWLGLAWLDIPAMAASHGVLNVVGFAVPASVASWLDVRQRRPGLAVGAPRSVEPDRPARRWAIGLVCGLAFAVAILVGGPMLGLLGIVALLALASAAPRSAPVGGFWLGLGGAWLLLFSTAAARCGSGCSFPDQTPWVAAAVAGFALGATLTGLAWRTR